LASRSSSWMYLWSFPWKCSVKSRDFADSYHQSKCQKQTAALAYIWVNYNDLTATSLEIMVSKGNHPQMALIQVGEIL